MVRVALYVMICNGASYHGAPFNIALYNATYMRFPLIIGMNLSELVETALYQEEGDDNLLLGSWIYYVSVSKPGYGIHLIEWRTI